MDTKSTYQIKQERVVSQLQLINQNGGSIAVSKRTSNLFRDRAPNNTPKLDFKDLNQVLYIDDKKLVAEVEAATTYQDLVNATLKHNLLPAVVPQFTTITMGGAVSGGACEASSFKYGAVHDTVEEMTILLANGEVVTATPSNEYKDLFFAIPNTFGSLGYILKLKVKLVRVKPFVKLQHIHFTDLESYFSAIESIWQERKYQGSSVDFLDGMVLSPNSLHLTIAYFTDEAPYYSDYTYMNIYYKSIPERNIDYLTVKDFIWRWDPDWVWGSKAFGMQNKVLRLLFGKFMLNSFSYWKIVGLDRRYKIAQKLAVFSRKAKETMVQDTETPLASSAEFLTFFMENFDLRPIWVCPIKSSRSEQFTFSPMNPNTFYINFGFWGSVTSNSSLPSNHFNQLLETSVANYEGYKALYSKVHYSEEEFWQIYDRKQFNVLKAKYDPQKRLKDLYQKVTN